MLIGLGIFVVGGFLVIQLIGSGSDAAPKVTAAPAHTVDSVALAASARQYLSDNFREMAWYPLVTSVSATGGTVVVDTSLYSDAEGKAAGQPICGAMRGMKAFYPEMNGFVVSDQSGRWICIR